MIETTICPHGHLIVGKVSFCEFCDELKKIESTLNITFYGSDPNLETVHAAD